MSQSEEEIRSESGIHTFQITIYRKVGDGYLAMLNVNQHLPMTANNSLVVVWHNFGQK